MILSVERFFLLLSAKLQNDTISLSERPSIGVADSFFEKLAPLVKE